jgi:hypothetical protein
MKDGFTNYGPDRIFFAEQNSLVAMSGPPVNFWRAVKVIHDHNVILFQTTSSPEPLPANSDTGIRLEECCTGTGERVTAEDMRFLLRLKHWQLFLITWGVPICINVFTLSKPALMVKLFPVMMVVFIIGIFGWIWAISTQLHKKLPMEVKLNIRGFKIIFSVPIVYMIGLTVWMAYQFYFRFPEGSEIGSIIVFVAFLHFISMVCILVGLRFAAQTLRSVELGRLAKFSEYAIEFFLICFSPIGYWILQPRLNKLIENA